MLFLDNWLLRVGRVFVVWKNCRMWLRHTLCWGAGLGNLQCPWVGPCRGNHKFLGLDVKSPTERSLGSYALLGLSQAVRVAYRSSTKPCPPSRLCHWEAITLRVTESFKYKSLHQTQNSQITSVLSFLCFLFVLEQQNWQWFWDYGFVLGCFFGLGLDCLLTATRKDPKRLEKTKKRGAF